MQRRGLLGLGVLGVLALAARPWWQPAGHAALLYEDASALVALAAGLPIAILLWTSGAAIRLAVCAAAVAAVAVLPPVLPVALIALPCVAAFRRAPAEMLAEARVGGAGLVRILFAVILPLALPGLIYGLALALAPGNFFWRLLAASLALVI